MKSDYNFLVTNTYLTRIGPSITQLSKINKGEIMLYYAIVFFIIAVIAGLLGFKGVESGATKISKLFFFIFLILAVLVVAATLLGINLVL